MSIDKVLCPSCSALWAVKEVGHDDDRVYWKCMDCKHEWSIKREDKNG